MRAISLLVFLITLWVGGCVTWPLDMVALHGTYDLISYEGKELPVDLSNGQVLVDGYCALNVRRDRLTVYLDYEGDAFGEPNPAYLTGALTFEDDLGLLQE